MVGKLRRLGHATWFFFQWPGFWLLAKTAYRRTDAEHPWVIGSHSGHRYADNCAALHRHARTRTGQPVIWLTANQKISDGLRAAGHPVLRKGSLAARLAILRAPALIYSHSESDLDEHFLYRLRVAGTRVFLNHCMHHIKSFHKTRWRPTRFDLLLASSARERSNFAAAYGGQCERIIVGGGAHLDNFFASAPRAERQRRILYAPTFRDPDVKAKALADVVGELTANRTLRRYLADAGYRFVVGHHVNSRPVPLPDEAGDLFESVGPEELIEEMRTCALLISDYSGVQCDYLIYNKPIIHFPFDLEQYRAVRELCVEYSEFAFGPVVRTVPQLVELLTSERWLDLDPYEKRREHWMEQYFPIRKPRYSERTFQTIQKHLSTSPR